MGAWIETLEPGTRALCYLSHPTWVRGLKPKLEAVISDAIPVAPYVGAWIETSTPILRRLKVPVAPYVGAWIETIHTLKNMGGVLVAPYVGAWIETPWLLNPMHIVRSHPTWVRGLKLLLFYAWRDNIRRTLRGCVD